MKKLTYLLVFALVIFYGCEKQESNSIAENPQTEDKESSVWAYIPGNDTPSWELVAINDHPDASGSSTFKQSNSAHTHGSIEGIGNWSGTENNGGTHGSAFIVLGPSEITMETECVMVLGNEAVYGGTITDITNPSGPLNVGGHLYLKVIDNGQGHNAPLDQHVPAILFRPAANSACGIYTPDYFFWGFFGTADVVDPGSVKVNN